MRILVIGHSGQVATALRSTAPRPGQTVITQGRPDLDLLAPDLAGKLARQHPHLVINTAAFTAVDRAETEREAAFALNADAPLRLARAAAALDIPLLHLSTDYVYDGEAAHPMAESHPAAPRSIYGQSKARGDLNVLEAHPRAFVFRTAWVYGPFGQNFLKTVLRLAQGDAPLRIVDDQWGNPTAARDIAGALLRLAEKILAGGAPRGGLYHLAGPGITTWHGFASEIVRQGSARGLIPPRPIVAIPTSEFPRPAPRPRYAGLDTARLEAEFGIRLPPWQESVGGALDEIGEAASRQAQR